MNTAHSSLHPNGIKYDGVGIPEFRNLAEWILETVEFNHLRRQHHIAADSIYEECGNERGFYECQRQLESGNISLVENYL
jgi:hypothetical protein